MRHKYTGQEWDSETGLYYYGARHYNPVVGRFISGDTVVSDPNDPQSLNRYSYTLDNPLKYTDPDGHGNEEFGTYWYSRSTSSNAPLYATTNLTWDNVQNTIAFSQLTVSGFQLLTGITALATLLPAPEVSAFATGAYGLSTIANGGLAVAGAGVATVRYFADSSYSLGKATTDVTMSLSLFAGGPVGGKIGGVFGPEYQRLGPILGNYTVAKTGDFYNTVSTCPQGTRVIRTPCRLTLM